MTTPRPHILPPNASALMRAVDQATPEWDTLPAALRGTLYGHPQTLGPWLADEWALGQFARYFDNTGQLLAAGLPWLMQRGTPASVLTAMAWLGFSGASLEEDGARLHIDPGRQITPEEAAQIAHVVRASIPAHVHFYRLHHGLDIRPLVWDATRWNAAVWENESGVPVPVQPWGDPVIVSQQTVNRRPAQQPLHTMQTARTAWAVRHLVAWPRARWDAWQWDAPVAADMPQAPSAVRHATRSATTAARQSLHTWPRTASHSITRHTPHTRAAHIASARTTARATQAAPWRKSTTWQGKWDARAWRANVTRQATQQP